MPDSGTVGNVIKLGGELLMPGASGLVDGNIKAGVGHALLGVAGSALLGPLGSLLVKANSYSYSVSDKHLHQHVADLFSWGSPETETALAAAPAAGE